MEHFLYYIFFGEEAQSTKCLNSYYFINCLCWYFQLRALHKKNLLGWKNLWNVGGKKDWYVCHVGQNTTWNLSKQTLSENDLGVWEVKLPTFRPPYLGGNPRLLIRFNRGLLALVKRTNITKWIKRYQHFTQHISSNFLTRAKQLKPLSTLSNKISLLLCQTLCTSKRCYSKIQHGWRDYFV